MLISLRITKDIIERVDQEALRRKWSRNATIGHLIECGLADSEQEPVRADKPVYGLGPLLKRGQSEILPPDSPVVIPPAPKTVGHHPRCKCSICVPQ